MTNDTFPASCGSAVRRRWDDRQPVQGRATRQDVTVVIPTFNRSGRVERALTSVLGERSSLDLELIVVVDGSTVGTRSMLEKFSREIKVITFDRNRGAELHEERRSAAGQGEWVKFLDSDDRLEPGALPR